MSWGAEHRITVTNRFGDRSDSTSMKLLKNRKRRGSKLTSTTKNSDLSKKKPKNEERSIIRECKEGKIANLCIAKRKKQTKELRGRWGKGTGKGGKERIITFNQFQSQLIILTKSMDWFVAGEKRNQISSTQKQTNVTQKLKRKTRKMKHCWHRFWKKRKLVTVSRKPWHDCRVFAISNQRQFIVLFFDRASLTEIFFFLIYADSFFLGFSSRFVSVVCREECKSEAPFCLLMVCQFALLLSLFFSSGGEWSARCETQMAESTISLKPSPNCEFLLPSRISRLD